MNIRIVPLTLGAVFIVGAIGIDLQLRATQRGDLRDVAALRTQLDSVTATLGSAATPADSARISAVVESRTQLLARREFHLPTRQETLDRWWTITGGGMLATVLGVVLLAAGVFRPGRRGG